MRSQKPPCPSGLSPRVRGNRCQRSGFHGFKRSIPARAGEPLRVGFQVKVDGVYPRACGGTIVTARTNRVDLGLSPRVRGNQVGRFPNQRYGGSIPARAGEPTPPTGRTSRRKVYPRACGGTGVIQEVVAQPEGLSPRVRGNRGVGGVPELDDRSIPARAGEPRSRRPWSSASWVYPRACGGTPMISTKTPITTGLSPRVRGNHGDPAVVRHRNRSIPARAGEPRRM